MHDRNVKLAGAAVEADRHSQVDRLPLKAVVVDAFDMPQEIDLDLLPLDDGPHNGCLGSVIVGVGDQELAVQGIGELLGCCPVAEIIDILGGVRPVRGKLFDVAVAFGPEIERLAADDERLVA
jgi:hypothetical protein